MKIADLYTYHRWANGRLFGVAVALGEDRCARDLGPHFSFPTLTRMFAHLYGADAVWLARWKGVSPTALPGADIASMAALRDRWAPLAEEQRAFVEALKPQDLERVVDYKATDGRPYRAPLGVLLEHVAMHGGHHRSEVATMLTMISASPPDTGIVAWQRAITGQA